ncbi:uncharacterized protein LOC117120346 [Anneissia japonica]|uniref:uncharacterized protein LOC117120346 n=1 Tax=Anneissia japonica TaxID=1529436 RepID=UPI0014257AE5|nr:uncharacterized protein LOC117120346 [Anneissia japonica]
MLDRIFVSACLLSVAVSSVMSATLATSCKCSKKIEKCPKLKCPPGSLPVENPCKGCCRVCGKTEGEECGGLNDIYGRCSPDLICQPGLFTFSKLSIPKGTCSKPFGFDMTADFIKLEDLHDDLWDDSWEFSFGSSEEVKELYNVFDVSKDYLRPEDANPELWEGWDFSFSSDQQSDKMSDFDNGITQRESSSSSNEIFDDWLFSFSSGSVSTFNENEINSRNSENNDVEGSGNFFNKINALD